MAIIERIVTAHEGVGNHCPMLDHPQAYDPFPTTVQGREVTVIPAESLDSAPTTFTQDCIENGVPRIPCTFACNVCRRHGAIGN